MAKKKAQEKAQQEKQAKEDKKNKQKEEKKSGQTLDIKSAKKQRSATPRRDRAESAHELPTGLDTVSVTVEEIMEKYRGKLHHEIIDLGLKLVAEKINDASLRCLAIIRAIIKFTKDYHCGK